MTIKEIKSLQTKKGRSALARFIIEGEKFTAEIPASWQIHLFCASEAFAAGRDISAFRERAPLQVLPDHRFASLCDTVTPQGILAVCEKRQAAFSPGNLPPNPLLLVCENLSDPGNVGTLIRTAAAAGAHGVLLSQGCVEAFCPKVLRAAAGAALRLPIWEGVVLPEVLPALQARGIAVTAAHLQGAVSPYATDFCRGAAILLGNEAHGLSPEATALADVRVRLPMAGGVESLNASVAGAILLYEAVRQRGAPHGI